MAPGASFMPCLIDARGPAPSLGEPLVDEYLRFTAARVRPNTLTAQAYDLKVFFTVVPKPPVQVTTSDVLAFIEAQRTPRRGANVVRLADGEVGLAASTIRRRLATVTSLFDYLLARGIVDRQVVPRSMTPRSRSLRGSPLVRAPRRLPRILEPVEAVALFAALRTERDRAMVTLMLHAGLRRCEVLGLRFVDVQPGDGRVFVAEGKGGHQRIVPVVPAFFTHLAAYLAQERPTGTDAESVFVVLKGPTRGRRLTAAGLDEVLAGARRRAGLSHASCHELRHTCFTRLREAGMSLEAIQAQAGHANLDTTRIYLHLSNDWLATEYQQAMAVLDRLYEEGPTP
ncbi:tyrosine-type recombinase/integrase [Ornithinimicrobium sp. Y1847]|uniref:tyrosine-type recombinase/integrase n=1 Tax=Ornithinimicrobium sp. Y1847 TaxID=3405419 RepID=UPI003B66B957